MEHAVRVFESEAAKELAKLHMRASCLKWHGERMTWITRFTYHVEPNNAKAAAYDYLIALYKAEEIEFWREQNGKPDEFFATFKMPKSTSLEGYRLDF